MATIKGLFNKVSALDIDKVTRDAMEETKDFIAQENVEQMNKGINAEDVKIGRYRNPVYAELKNLQNPLPGYGVPDLRLTGAFYQGIRTEISGDKVITTSNDPKTEKLIKQYGPKIFGLSDPYKREFLNDHLRPTFSEKIKEAIGIKPK